MDLEFRLQLLQDSEQIDESCKKSVLAVIKWFAEQLNIKLTEDNASMFITHLAMAVSRLQKDEPLEEPDEAVLAELESSSMYREAVEVVDEFCKLLPVELPQSERNFLLIHVIPLADI